MGKKEFEFYQDVKVTVWQRQHFRVEAESIEEARKKAKQYADKDISFCEEVEADEIEWLYDTEEHINPDENGGCATIEVYEYKSKYEGLLIADNAASKELSAMEGSRKVLGYQIHDDEGEFPEDLFDHMVFKTRADAESYMLVEDLTGFDIYEYYEGDIEDPAFIGIRMFKKGERVFNNEPSPAESDLRGWATVCEDTVVIYADEIVLLTMDDGSENETDSHSIYQVAEGKVCPKCGGSLCIEHEEEIDYPYYCPECDENFYYCEVQ